MKEIKVVFDSMEECRKYLHTVENLPYDLDLQWGSCVIDGKSMLGVLGFGLRKILELRMHTDDAEEEGKLMKQLDFCTCREMGLVV